MAPCAPNPTRGFLANTTHDKCQAGGCGAFCGRNSSKLQPTLQQGCTYILGRNYVISQPTVTKVIVEKFFEQNPVHNNTRHNTNNHTRNHTRNHTHTHTNTNTNTNNNGNHNHNHDPTAAHDNNNGIYWNVFDAFSINLGELDLSQGGMKIRDVPNAGGSSVASEIMSFEVLHKMFDAQLWKTEMEISYFPNGGSIMDYTALVNGRKVGVSVTRAMKYSGVFTDDDAEFLLRKKLNGLQYAGRNVMKRDRWEHALLHIWCASASVARVVRRQYFQMERELTNDVMIILTVSKNADWIYKEKQNTFRSNL